jgi:hypothetical protein
LPIGTRLIVAALKEENHAGQPNSNPFPLPTGPSQRLGLQQLWENLPEPERQRTLEVLARVVAQQLQRPPNDQEVRYEDC